MLFKADFRYWAMDVRRRDARQTAQLVVDERQKFIQRLPLADAPVVQQLRYFVRVV